jgi:hypothetical protein
LEGLDIDNTIYIRERQHHLITDIRGKMRLEHLFAEFAEK